MAAVAARNEAWVLNYSLAAVLQWCDAAVVFCHACEDATLEIADRQRVATGRVNIIVEPDPEWREMEHRQRMLICARQMGATHIAMVDSDEILTPNIYNDIRRVSERLEPGRLLTTPWLNLWRSLDVYRNDGTRNGRQWASLVFRDVPGLGWGGDEQFHHRHPRGIDHAAALRIPATREAGGLMHLQRANWSRAMARQDLYRMVEVTRWPGREPVHEVDLRYAASLDEVGAGLLPVPAPWWDHGIDRSMIDLRAEPWEARECRRMLTKHGWQTFNGLNLAGGW